MDSTETKVPLFRRSEERRRRSPALERLRVGLRRVSKGTAAVRSSPLVTDQAVSVPPPYAICSADEAAGSGGGGGGAIGDVRRRRLGV